MWFLIWCLVFAHAKAASWEDVTATIAVVEFDPIRNTSLTEEQRVVANVAKYNAILAEIAKDTTVDLVIFPEGSLRVNYETAAPITVNDNPIDKKTYPNYILSLAQAAQKYNTYLVTNMVDKVECGNDTQSTNCQDRGFYFYNTDVVFDRKGTIINKYHKLNLFGEVNRDRAPVPEVVTIDTDFGLKFGIFTCFDILFKNPAQDVLEEDIDGIIYPTNWHSELPFLTALQAQQMWAYAHNITLLAAGGNYPTESSGGSGIYTGAGNIVATTLVAQGGSNVLLYQINKGQVVTPEETTSVADLSSEMDAFPLWQDDSLSQYQSEILDLKEEKKINKTICSGAFCCNFQIQLSEFLPQSSYFFVYRLAAFSGIREYEGIGDAGLEVCGIISCTTGDISTCGKRFTSYNVTDWPQSFQEITITADFEINENKTQFPNSLLSSIRPIDASETEWSSQEVEVDGKKVIRRTFATKKEQNRLLTFAIYGRNFALDRLPTTSGGHAGKGTWLTIAGLILATLKLM